LNSKNCEANTQRIPHLSLSFLGPLRIQTLRTVACSRQPSWHRSGPKYGGWSWSCAGRDNKYIKLDLAKDVNQFIDLLVTHKGTTSFYAFLYSTPFRYYDIFNKHGTYVFTIQVVASDAKPVVIKILFTWNWIWNMFEAKKYDE
jgi:hypothetical protein